MRKTSKFILIPIFTMFLFSNLKAQETICINLDNGSVIEVKISQIRKITFQNVNIITSESNLIISQLSNLALYPNPAKYFVNINCTLVSNGNVMLEIYSMNGTLMKRIKKGNLQAAEYKFQLKTTDLSSGIYTCVIRQNQTQISKKLIVTN